MAQAGASDPLDALMQQHGAVPAGTSAGTAAPASDLDALMQQHGAIVPDFKTTAEKPSALDLGVATLKGFGSQFNPWPFLKSLYDNQQGEFAKAAEARKAGRTVEAVQHATAASNAYTPQGIGEAALKGLAAAHWDQLKKAKAAYDAGDLTTALAHTAAGLVPIVGPQAGAAGEDIRAGLETGDTARVAHGIGAAFGVLAPFGLKYSAEVVRTGSAVPTTAKVAASPGRLALPPIARNPNPTEAAAADFGLDRGIPVDAGTATGNPVVRGTRAVAENTSLTGAYLGNKARATQADALSRVGNELATDVHPSPVVPTQAGEGVRSAIESLRDQLHEQANTAYEKLREIERDPAFEERLSTAPPGSPAAKAILRKMAEGLGTDVEPTPALQKQMWRVWEELDSVPFTSRTWNSLEGETGLRGNAAGGHADLVPGSAGAPVYHDVLQAAPGTSNMTRSEVARSIRKMLETGEVTNAGRGALEVARARLEGRSGLSAPILPPNAGDMRYAAGPLESVALPVDLTSVKKMLLPVRDQMKRQMPATQIMANPGLKALENIVDGPDYAPLSQVDRDLSAIKAIARSQGGLAKLAVSRLDVAVRAAAAKGGPDAVQALEEGRAATVAKYGAQAVLDQLHNEPRQVFDQLTRPKDSAIDQLKAVQEYAPAELPKIGRAVIEDLLQTATAEGGFSRAQGLFARWQNLGPQTKQVLFGNPGNVQNLDRFFLLAKKAAENPNPSGSAYVGGLLAHGYVFRDPVTFASWEIAGGALSKLLRSPRAVRALTQGMSVPIGNKTAAGAATAAILKVASDEGVPVISVPAAADQATPGRERSQR